MLALLSKYFIQVNGCTILVPTGNSQLTASMPRHRYADYRYGSIVRSYSVLETSLTRHECALLALPMAGRRQVERQGQRYRAADGAAPAHAGQQRGAAAVLTACA